MPSDQENVYAPPRADLGKEEAGPPRRRGWTVYLWIIAPLTAVSLAYLWLTGNPRLLDLADLLSIVAGLAGLYGYAYRKRIGDVRFWRAFAPGVVVWDLVLNSVLVPAGLAYQHPDVLNQSQGELVLGLVINLPIYVALFLYAYRSADLWAGESATGGIPST